MLYDSFIMPRIKIAERSQQTGSRMLYVQSLPGRVRRCGLRSMADASILHFQGDAGNPGVDQITSAMLLAKTGKLAVVESFGEFDNVDRVNVEKLTRKCKVIFGSTNPRKLDPSFFTIEFAKTRYQVFDASSERITAISYNRKKNILIENLPTGFAVFQCNAPTQIHDLVASVNEWVYLQRQ